LLIKSFRHEYTSYKEDTYAGNRITRAKEKIRKRAHQLYEERLWKNGHDIEDWLRAEEEILEQEARPKAA
jgi:hypothetical protein